jgi:sugar/nucleoside kinase (ribokinase family)
MEPSPHIVAMGHAIVDVLAPCADDLVRAAGLEKGTMTLIDDVRAEEIYALLGPATEASGGSAANTAACLASLGTSVAFLGKVADDVLGKVFTHDIRSCGVSFDVPTADSGPGTGRCLVMVTPDAEKTMSTNLGVGGVLAAEDVPDHLVSAARVLYLEGYLVGKADTEAAVDKAVSVARESGTLVAFSASDPAWVELKRDALLALLARADLLFANEHEAVGLTGAADVDEALDRLTAGGATVAVTLGGEGCVVARPDGSRTRVPAAPVDHVVDTTGAGDSFAAGYLHGLVNGMSVEASARLGALVAAEVVSHIGARPLRSLASLAAEAGLLS